MAQNSDVDVLIDVKNAYFIGNYQQCINEAQKLKGLTVEQSNLRDAFVYRAYIVQKKFSVVIDEITPSSTPELQSIRLLAEFLSFPSKRDAIVEKIDKQMSSGFDADNATMITVAAMIYHHVANYEAALRVLHQGDHLECSALTIQSLLAIDRVDLARKELKSMIEKDEDAMLTQLATVWVNLFTGGEKLQEAFYITQEISDKYGSTPLLLNLLACCYAAQGKYHDVETVLQESLDKDPNNADTLINLFVNSNYVGKTPEVANRYFSQLKDAHANHPFVQNYYKKENEFDRVSKIFQHA
jgi:coatomer protein complex subunit epsilon